MNTPGQHTLDEILSQPEAWGAALQQIRAQVNTLRDFYRAGQYEMLIFTGCGSAYYLSLAAAALYRQLSGAFASGLPASEIWLYPGPAYPANRRALLVALSRSGETTETLRACEAFRARGGDVLTLSCYPGRAMTTLGALNLVIPSGQEESIAQTRAFTALYVATVALIALWTGNDGLFEELGRLPAACRRLLDTYRDSARKRGSDSALDRFYFLGSGLFHGLACELSLKMKEMSLSHSEPFHFMEFRHGPKSMITASTLIVGLLSQANQVYERAMLDEMRSGGAHVLAIGEDNADVLLASGVGEAARGALYLPAGQLMAFERAISHGLDPDRPNNLDAVVRLK
jgi:glucosamine--fructose-6-phosphate aminotransferase (isomerizing)